MFDPHFLRENEYLKFCPSFAICWWPNRFPLFFELERNAHTVCRRRTIRLILVTNTSICSSGEFVLDESSLRRVPFPVPCKYFNKGFSFRISTPPITLSLLLLHVRRLHSICRPPISCISHACAIILCRDATNEKVRTVSYSGVRFCYRFTCCCSISICK